MNEALAPQGKPSCSYADGLCRTAAAARSNMSAEMCADKAQRAALAFPPAPLRSGWSSISPQSDLTLSLCSLRLGFLLFTPASASVGFQGFFLLLSMLYYVK